GTRVRAWVEILLSESLALIARGTRVVRVGDVIAAVSREAAPTDEVGIESEERRLRRRRLELDPAVVREVRLDPRVRVELLHHVLAGVRVERSGRIALDEARRDTHLAEHHRHR